MNQKPKVNKRMLLAFLAGLLIFGSGIFIAFSRYQTQLNDEFESLTMEILTAYAESQGSLVSSTVKDVEGSLRSIAVLLENADTPPDEAQLKQSLSILGQSWKQYQVQYFTRNYLEQRAASPQATDNYRHTCERLAQGEFVISEIEYSPFQTESYIFSIGVPVMQNGEMVGALRSIIDVETLLHNSQSDKLNEPVNSWIIHGDGNALYTIHEINGNIDNLFTLFDQNKNAVLLKQQLKECLESKNPETFQIRTAEEGPLFASVTWLGYNDWYLVNFAKEKETTTASVNILNNGLRIGVMLISVTALAAAFVYGIMQRQKRTLTLEQKRYAALSRFSDTILFEYHWQSDTLEFTSNAEKNILLKSLKLHHFLDVSTLSSLLHPDDIETLYECFKNPPRGTPDPAECEIRILDRSHHYRWYTCQYQPVYELHRYQPVILIGKLTDIDEQKKKENELLLQSSQDGLTGLLNKQTIEDTVRERLKEGLCGCLFMLDLDNFKEVNDIQGHAAGDRLLRDIGKCLHHCFRQEDLIGRIGGDEFVVFLETSNMKVLRRKAEQMIQSMAELSDYEGFAVSISIGAALTLDGQTYEELFNRADQAMYQAKTAGKNQYCFADLDDESEDVDE